MSMKKCLQCNSELTGTQRKFCSKKCDDVWKYENNKAKTNCEYCGTEFEYPAKRVSNKPSFCSRSCIAKNRQEKLPIERQELQSDTISALFINSDNPLVKGEVSELLCKAYLVLSGYEVYDSPSASRTDFLATKDGKILKIQVKTVSMDRGKFKVTLVKKSKNASKKILRYSKDELDLLIAYSPYHNAIIQLDGSMCYDKDTITFSSKSEGNYCGTSRFFEDYIVLKL